MMCRSEWKGVRMKLLDIVENLKDFDVPIYILNESELQNKKYCYAIVIPTDKLAFFRGVKSSGNCKDVGVYIIDCDLTDFYDANKSTNFEATKQIERIIKKELQLLDGEYVLAFAVFSILHEIGHMKHLQNSQMSFQEYYDTYQKDWDNIYKEYLFMYKLYGTTQERIKEVNSLYGEKYRSHAFESYADEFAIQHLEECMNILRNVK